MKTLYLSLLGALLLPSAAYSRPASDSPKTVELIVQPSPAASLRSPQLQKINDMLVLHGSVVRTAGHSAGGGAHVDATLKDSRGRILAVLNDQVDFNRHPVTKWHRTSHFALAWPAADYPTLHSVSVRYAAGSHARCASKRGEP
jgi:hypothetical protein